MDNKQSAPASPTSMSDDMASFEPSDPSKWRDAVPSSSENEADTESLDEDSESRKRSRKKRTSSKRSSPAIAPNLDRTSEDPQPDVPVVQALRSSSAGPARRKSFSKAEREKMFDAHQEDLERKFGTMEVETKDGEKIVVSERDAYLQRLARAIPMRGEPSNSDKEQSNTTLGSDAGHTEELPERAERPIEEDYLGPWIVVPGLGEFTRKWMTEREEKKKMKQVEEETDT